MQLNVHIHETKELILFQVELHCHLDGAVRPETVLDMAKYANCLFQS